MWIYSKTGFVSIVEFIGEPGKVLVRARVREDLDNFLANVDRITLGGDPQDPSGRGEVVAAGHDYKYRAKITKAQAGSALFNMAGEIDYSNFKGSIPQGPTNRHSVYFGVWSETTRLSAADPERRGWPWAFGGDDWED